jgi:cephalosporin hydroxylase
MKETRGQYVAPREAQERKVKQAREARERYQRYLAALDKNAKMAKVMAERELNDTANHKGGVWEQLLLPGQKTYTSLSG